MRLAAAARSASIIHLTDTGSLSYTTLKVETIGRGAGLRGGTTSLDGQGLSGDESNPPTGWGRIIPPHMANALKLAPIVAFLATSNAHQAKLFYCDALGLELVGEDPFALVFDAAGTMLRISIVEKAVIAPYTALGWRVSDIAAATRDLRSRGVSFERYSGMNQDETGVWQSPGGARIAWFKDPDGHTLSITQFS